MTGENIGTVFLGLQLDRKEYEKGLGQANNQAKDLKETFKELGKTMLVAFATTKILKFFQTSINLASSLTEVQNVIDTTFGDSSKTIDNFAKNTAKSFGLSELAAKKYAGTMGALLKSTGITETATKDMSIALTALAGDYSSFYNVSTQDAFDKIMAGISGESEPLRRWGKNLSAANLQAYALTKGIKVQYDSLTENAKVLLRYNYLLELSQDTLGDYNKTSQTYANQVRTQQLRLEEMQTTIGKGLIPTQLAFYRLSNVILGVFNQLNPTIQMSIMVFGGLALAIKGLSFVLGFTISPLMLVLTALAGTAALVGISKMNGKLNDTSKNFNDIYKGTDNLAGTLKGMNKELGKTNKYLASFDQITNVGEDGIAGSLIGNVDTSELANAVNMTQQLYDMKPQPSIWTNLWTGFQQSSWYKFWGGIGIWVYEKWQGVKIGYTTLWVLFQQSDWYRFWYNLPNWISNIWNSIKITYTTLWVLFQQSDWYKFWYNLPTWISTQWSKIKITSIDLWSDWKNGASIAINWFKQQFESLRINATNIFSGLKEALTPIANHIVNVLRALNLIADPKKGYEQLLRNREVIARAQEIAKYDPALAKSIISSLPGYATGGRPALNKLSLVGERGPELFVPDQRGTIIPNKDLQNMGGSNGSNDMGSIMSMLSSMSSNSDRPLNITLKVNERIFGEIATNSINKLSEERGEVVIRV